MKKFGERMKDFMYDAVDYILIILTIVVVAGVITWRLNIMFKKNTADKSPSTNETISSDNNKNSDKSQPSDKDNKSDNSKEENIVNVKVVIPQGSPCPNIANILLEKGLIKDKDEFLAKAKEMNLDTKLKSGEYEIKSNSTIEEILSVMSK